jgi:DNA-directed RNA polymerase specialized sigma24 family protein
MPCGSRTDDTANDGLDSLAARGPTPDEAAILAEECGRLLARLDDDLRRVALGKMEGFTNAEIASRLGRSEAAVERKLKLIRKCSEL